MEGLLRHKLMLFCLLLWTGGLSAQTYQYVPTAEDRSNTTERIIDFHADINIEASGKILITEYITLYAGGMDIRRGIIRNIPEARIDERNKAKILPVKVRSLKCDGEESRYHIKYVDRFGFPEIEIYFGSSKTILEKGVHQYELIYEIRGHIGFFDEFDELYWNVVGNEWEFPIERASAKVHLPKASKMIQWSCYTGVKYSTEKKCSLDGDMTTPIFTTINVLPPHEGFTIAVAFPRGIVKRQSILQLSWRSCRNWLYGGIVMLISIICLGGLWYKRGREPKKNTPTVQFGPPRGWSPSTIRYLYNRTFDNKAFTATLLQMAIKGGIVIEKRKKQYLLTAKNRERLSREESKVYDVLFSVSETVCVAYDNRKQLSRAVESLRIQTAIDTPIYKYYKENANFKVYGFLIVVAILLAFFIMLYNLNSGGLLVSFVVTLTLIIIFRKYCRLIGAQTELGAQVMAELEGFKMYIGTAEKQWLDGLTPLDRTPEHFEEMLPYAVALDVENQWCEKFDNVLEKYSYEPQWCTGDDFSSNFFSSSFATTKFIEVFNSNIIKFSYYSSSSASSSSNSFSSSSGSSDWSSGSSGGGFSGGGGGGGGGRGW